MLISIATKKQLLSKLMSWEASQNNPIYFNFHFKKSFEIFEKKSADKIWSNKNIRVKVPCPMPDRVKATEYLVLE